MGPTISKEVDVVKPNIVTQSQRQKEREQQRLIIEQYIKEKFQICELAIGNIQFPCDHDEFQNIKTEMMHEYDEKVGVARNHPEAQQFRNSFKNQLTQLLNIARNNNDEESRRVLNATSEEMLNACNLKIGNIQFPCDHDEFQNIKTEMIRRYDEKVGVARRHPEAQQFRNSFKNQLTQLLIIARNNNDEESVRVLNATSEKMLNACDLAIGIIQLPCADEIVRNVKTEMMNRFNQNVGVARSHPEAQQIRNNFEIQIDQRINEAILRNTLTIVKRDATSKCIDEIRRIIYPCRDVETPLEQIKQKTLIEFAQRLFEVADDNPQKTAFRARLNNTIDRHIQVVICSNEVNSVELLEREHQELTVRLQNKGFFTRATTIVAEFQTHLKGLVVSNLCDDLVLKLEMIAQEMKESADKQVIMTFGVGGIVMLLSHNPIGLPFAYWLSGKFCQNDYAKSSLKIRDCIQTALQRARNKLNNAQRELETDEEVMTNTNNRRRRRSDDSPENERPSKVRKTEE